jgi:pectate lyase
MKKSPPCSHYTSKWMPAFKWAAGVAISGMLIGWNANATVSMPYYDGFNYSEGNLNAVGGPNWVAGNGSSTLEIAVTNPATLAVPAGYPTATGKGVRRAPSGTARRSVLQYTSVPNALSNTVYVSFLLNVQTTPGGNELIGYLDNNSSSQGSPQGGIFIGSGPSVGIGKKSSTPGFTSAITGGTTHLVIVRYTFMSANDQVDLWVDPSSTSYGAAIAPASLGSTTGGTDPASLDYFQLSTSSGAGSVAFIDEFRVGTAWADVVPSGGPIIGAQLLFTTQPANSAPNATLPAVVVQVASTNGAAAASNNVPITLAMTSGSGTFNGTLTQNTDVNGKATFNDLSIDTVGVKQLTASASGIGTGLTSIVSSNFTIVTAAFATKLGFTTQPSDTTVNLTINPVVVQVQDANGVAVASNGVTVLLTLTASGAVLNGTPTRTTDATGKATFNDLSVSATGTGDYLNAAASGTGAGLAGTQSATFNVNAAAAPSGISITQTVNSATGLIVRGTNTAAGAFCQIVGSPDITLDPANWILVNYDNFDANGSIGFTNPTSVAMPHAFYRLRTGSTDTKIQAPGLTPLANQTVAAGTSVSFSTIATAPLLQYLWLLNGNPIAGATTSALSIPNAQAANAGTYTVIVANPAGSVSSSATLRVGNFAPTIVSPPQNATVTAGADAVFNVVADGTAPLTYVWRDNLNNVISGVNTATLTLSAVATNQSGTYSVQVSNNFGSTNRSATLTVNDVPTAPPDTNMIGFAALANVTGGSFGGNTTTIHATNYLQFSNLVRHTEALIIKITNHITGPGPGVDEFCYVYGPNKTIIGEGTNAGIDGVDLRVNASNVIIANLTFQVTPIGTNDAITIDGGSKGTGIGVWVDHCTISNAQDGSIDVTKGADMVTVSWCKFLYGPKIPGNVHEFVHLIGSSDSDGSSSQLFHVTLHHNWYGTNAMERMPSVRWGRVHVFNSFYTASGNNYCARTRIGSQVLVENNFYQGVQNPWELYTTSGTTGLLLAVSNNIPYLSTAYGNTWVNGWTSGASLIPGTDSLSYFSPVPYSYTPDDASVVPYYVQTYSGAGKYPYAP